MIWHFKFFFILQNSIQTHKHQNSGEVFLDDSKLVQEKESLLEQKKLFHEEKTNFLEERKQFTEAAIKLGKEASFLKTKEFTSHFSLSHTYFHAGFVLNEYNYQIFLTDMGKLSYLK